MSRSPVAPIAIPRLVRQRWRALRQAVPRVARSIDASGGQRSLTTAQTAPLEALAIRPMQRRWGSYSGKGRITLNTDFVRAPLPGID
jgi:hypothetical protein